MLKIDTVDLEQVGFVDCSFVSDSKPIVKHYVFQLFDKPSNTNLILCTSGTDWVLKDGRAMVDKEYYRGAFPTMKELVSLLLQNSGNGLYSVMTKDLKGGI